MNGREGFPSEVIIDFCRYGMRVMEADLFIDRLGGVEEKEPRELATILRILVKA